MNAFSFKSKNKDVGLKIKVKMFALRTLINVLHDLTLRTSFKVGHPRDQLMINTLKSTKAWSLSLSSRVTHASLSSSHGSDLFHANASSRHHTLLMLICRSQSEVKTPITISINSIQPPAFGGRGTKNWNHRFPLPGLRHLQEREMTVYVCTYSYKAG